MPSGVHNNHKGGKRPSGLITKVVKLPFRDEAEYRQFLRVKPRKRVELVLGAGESPNGK